MDSEHPVCSVSPPRGLTRGDKGDSGREGSRWSPPGPCPFVTAPDTCPRCPFPLPFAGGRRCGDGDCR